MKSYTISPHHLKLVALFAVVVAVGAMLAVPQFLGSRGIRAKAADVTGPITINDSNYGNGVFSGNWESSDPNVPAVTIATTQPVTIINSQVKGPGDLIATAVDGTNVTIRNTSGYALNPNIAGRSKGDFFHAYNVAKVLVENCYMQDVDFGVYITGYTGSLTGAQNITIEANRGKNMDGRHSDGNGGYVQSQSDRSWSHFVQISQVHHVAGIEIAWNEAIDEPYNSSVDDVINIYDTSGTPDSPILIHDNYVQGAYPVHPATDGFSGGGIITDGNHDTQDNAPAYVHIYNNQVVSTTNYGIGFSNGHDNDAYNNRVISSGVLADGTYLSAQNVGMYISDIYGGNVQNGTFHDNHAHDNVIGWVNRGSNYAWNNYRNDMYFPSEGGADPGDYGRNTLLPNPITYDMEVAEWNTWQQKVSQASVNIGPRNATDLGGLTRLGDYCRSLGDTDVSLDGNTAFDWHCVTSSGDHVGIDVNDSCHWHYPDAANPYATFIMTDPFSWECWT